MSIMEEPLLSAENQGGGSGRWNSSYQYVGGAGSVIPTASLAGTEVSVDEIRSAAAAASSPYPPSLHAPLVSSPQSYQSQPHEPGFNYHVGYYGEVARAAGGDRRQVLDEVEIRKLLVDHVGHHWCWGSRPARTWKIHAVEDCNVYVGTLDTFIEEREMITETEPYSGGNIEGKDKKPEPEPGIWELDLRSEFPVLFIPHKESRTRVPHSEKIDKCPGCRGLGSVVCPNCNADHDPGFYNVGQMSKCPTCYGRGLLAYKDGSDIICRNCKGHGKLPCANCESRGLIKCQTCKGGGSFLSYKVAIVRWKTLSTRKVNATSGAASVPDDVFHKAKGVQLCNNQAHQCTPAYFADSYFLNKFSSEVIAERADVPQTARVICERHTISVVPVTRVTMTHHKRSFSFYIIGVSMEVYLCDDYPSRFCWGLCPCLEWLNA
ncbi:PREDICTED: protein SSUH2 homolog [Ipomoea nil]|uniref:protein SSUH2 homolog n=1 Tax=Ipomoea nil TaxID=35883 RepID=UPI000901D495|nr:PREDICTED: protein SSUH2 homolog [Ipomoea nil]